MDQTARAAHNDESVGRTAAAAAGDGSAAAGLGLTRRPEQRGHVLREHQHRADLMGNAITLSTTLSARKTHSRKTQQLGQGLQSIHQEALGRPYMLILQLVPICSQSPVRWAMQRPGCQGFDRNVTGRVHQRLDRGRCDCRESNLGRRNHNCNNTAVSEVGSSEYHSMHWHRSLSPGCLLLCFAGTTTTRAKYFTPKFHAHWCQFTDV